MKQKVLIILVVGMAFVAGYILINASKKDKVDSYDLKKITEEVKTKQEKQSEIASEPKKQGNNPNNNSSNISKPMELKIETIQEGTGERIVKSGDTISVHYAGKLTDGTKFDSSVDRGIPFTFQIGQGMVIQGWEQGFIGAKVGEKRILTIPAEMGYGSRDMGTIPPNSTLIFDVELVSIQ